MSLKKLLVASILVLAPTVYSYAQCSFDVDKKDPFTNEQARSGSYKIGPALWHWKLMLEQKGKTYSWGMQIKWGVHYEDAITKGQKVFIRLEDGKVIELIADQDYFPTHVVASDGFITTTYSPKGPMDVATMQALASSPITNLRITLAGKDFDPKISSKQATSIQEAAGCLIK